MTPLAGSVRRSRRRRDEPRPLEPVVLDARVICGTGGGPDKTILNSPRFLKRLGYRMLCAYMHPPGDPGFAAIREKAARWQAPLVAVTDRGPWDLSVLPELLGVCRRERVAIWHGHDYKSNLIGLLLQRFWPMRLVTTLHGWVHQTRRTPLYYWIDRLCLPHYERIIGVSADLCAKAKECGTPAERCVLIENGVDTQEFRRRSDGSLARKALNIRADRFVIGSLGRLSPEKGFDTLIRAVDQLVRDGCDVELLVAGEGSEESALRELVHRLGREHRIRLLGYCSDPRGFYEALDLFALSSRREGLPNVLLEAMAMELPVVATRIAGIPQLVEHEQNGVLVEPDDAAGLAGALRRLCGDPDARARLAAAARRTIEVHYSFAVRMEKISRLYDELLHNPAKGDDRR